MRGRGSPMRVVIAQMRVGRELAENAETICSFLRRAAPGDWVVFPEGALTGYFPDEVDYLGAPFPGTVGAAEASRRPGGLPPQRGGCFLGARAFRATLHASRISGRRVTIERLRRR